MEKKHYLILDDEFIKFCQLNGITDIEKKAKEVFNQGFTTLKYGNTPTKIIEGKEKTNNKVVTSPRPNVMPAPQKIKKKDELYD